MNCIIAADIVTCKLLVDFVGKCSPLNLIGSFTDSVSVRNQLSERHDIDLLFLDIELLEMDWFDFIGTIDYKPNIILLSSTSHYAIKAFDISVVDYLLKPVTYPRFRRAVDKSIRYYSRREVSNNGDNEIFIKNESSLVKLKLIDIIYIEALENYITLVTNKKKVYHSFYHESNRGSISFRDFYQSAQIIYSEQEHDKCHSGKLPRSDCRRYS